MQIDTIWESFLTKIKDQVTPIMFNTWFEDTKLIKIEENILIVEVPSEIHKKHLNESYYEIINELINEITGTNFKIEFKLEQENKKEEEQLGVPFLKPKDANLNTDYSFEEFIVGDSNKFAHAAALAVAENPGSVYNPLFLFGKSGLGKTHLMHAIGNFILQNSNKTVLYITSEQFIEDFIGLAKKSNNLDYVKYFKDKYRNIDTLIVDDIQFFAGASGTQQEFFQTFNKLYNDKKQIIISSDRSPDDLKLLEERLRTRFNWGLTVNIYPPDFKLRKDILLRKIQHNALKDDIPEEVIDYIATNCESDVRKLEGAITRLFAYSAMMGYDNINLNLAIEALKDYININHQIKNKIHQIQRIVTDYYKISIDDLKSKKRTKTITEPRQIAMYLCRNNSSESFPKIGSEFGGRDHTTVMHACNKIKNERKINKEFEKLLIKFEKDL